MTLGGNAAAYASGNTFGGDLACSGTSVVGDFGVPTTVGGAKTGQCVRL